MSDRQLLASTQAGTEFLDLVDTRISHDPKLQTELVSAAGKLAKQMSVQAGGKENGGMASSGSDDPQELAANSTVVLRDITFTNPRGKFDLFFCKDVLVMHNPKTVLRVPTESVTHVAVLEDIPKDTKKRILLFVAFAKNSNILSGKQRLDAVVVQTLSSETMRAKPRDGPPLEGQVAVVVCQALGLVGPNLQFVSPNPDFYQTSQGKKAVAANVKASSGFLFPMDKALAFVEKPALLLQHDTILAVEFRRTQSSTFDIVLHCVSSAPGKPEGAVQEVEFSQIDRAELGRLQNYVAKSKLKLFDPAAPPRAGASKPAGVAGAEAAGAAPGGDDGGDDDSDDDPDDEDYDPRAQDSPVERSRPATRKRPRGDGDGAGPSSAAVGGDGPSADDEDDEDEEVGPNSEDEEDDESDEDEAMDDLTDEEDISAHALKQRIASERSRGGGSAASGAGTSAAAQRQQQRRQAQDDLEEEEEDMLSDEDE